MSGLRLIAPAKLNLYLHVLGRRADGYHLLDSLVAFTAFGDQLSVWPDSALSLQITGPFADGIGPLVRNLVLRAANGLAQAAGINQPGAPGARIELVKNLPPASGIGGGSSDAAATIRLLSKLWNVTLEPEQEHKLALGLGADVPVCLFGAPALMRGIGETLAPAPALPPLYVLVANPGIAMPTGPVFEKLAGRFGACAPPLPEMADATAVARWLAGQRNDLQPPAIELAPEIGVFLDAMAALPGCLLARMSGSGASCFALFAMAEAMNGAAAILKQRHPVVWHAATEILHNRPAIQTC